VIPEFAVHYHLADRRPFLNLSDLDSVELERVFADLTGRRETHGSKRVFGSKYMELRRLTEARLHELFILAGGRPQRGAPHYFCLGPCEWFQRSASDMRTVAITLSALPDDVTSFTYPDSFTAMGFLRQFGITHAAKPYHGRVYRMNELAEVVREHGLPTGGADDDYEGYHRREFEKYIEIQVWSDDAIRAEGAPCG
jgi:hypothetical protein